MTQVLFDGLVPYIFFKKFSNNFNKKNIKKIKTNLEECILFFNDYNESFIKFNDIEITQNNITLKKNFSIIQLLNMNSDIIKFNNIFLGFNFNLDDNVKLKPELSEYGTGDFDKIALRLNKKIHNKDFDNYYENKIEEKIKEIIKVKIVNNLENTEKNTDTIYFIKKDVNTYGQYLFDKDKSEFIYFNDIKFYNLRKDLLENDIEFICNKYLNISNIFDDNMQGYVKEKDLNLKLENYVNNKEIIKYQTKKDVCLNTNQKEIVSGINELKSQQDNLNEKNNYFQNTQNEIFNKIQELQKEQDIIKDKQENLKIDVDKGLENSNGVISVRTDNSTILIDENNNITLNKDYSNVKVKTIRFVNVKENEILPLNTIDFPTILKTYKLNDNIDNINKINITNFNENLCGEEDKEKFSSSPLKIKVRSIKIPVTNKLSNIIKKSDFDNIEEIDME